MHLFINEILVTEKLNLITDALFSEYRKVWTNIHTTVTRPNTRRKVVKKREKEKKFNCSCTLLASLVLSLLSNRTYHLSTLSRRETLHNSNCIIYYFPFSLCLRSTLSRPKFGQRRWFTSLVSADAEIKIPRKAQDIPLWPFRSPSGRGTKKTVGRAHTVTAGPVNRDANNSINQKYSHRRLKMKWKQINIGRSNEKTKIIAYVSIRHGAHKVRISTELSGSRWHADKDSPLQLSLAESQRRPSRARESESARQLPASSEQERML